MANSLILRRSAQNLPECLENGQIPDYSPHIMSDRLLDMLDKRGLIAHYGEIKMRKVKPETLERQAKIKKCCDSISFMNIQSEIDGLPKLMNDIGVANPSQFTLEQIPSDFLYLSSIFE